MENSLKEKVTEMAKTAKEASIAIGLASEALRNEALLNMARNLRKHISTILDANRIDVDKATESNISASLIDRLLLNEERVEEMALALENLCKLDDPINKKLQTNKMYNGIEVQKISVPLGLVGVIYEARPNVTADAAGICIKSGNACILKGGSLAHESNCTIAEILSDSIAEVGLPKEAITYIPFTDRQATDILLQLHGIIDVLIPRGGAGLIQHCVLNSTVPVIETGTGNCHVFVHESCDIDMAKRIVLNSKCRRLGVCNAAETLLIDTNLSDDNALTILSSLIDSGITLHVDDRAFELCKKSGLDENYFLLATEDDWEKEYLSADLAVKYVSDINQAIQHINKFGTKHSESIVTNNIEAAEQFLNEVDAAAVYHNAATAFTDGGQFGLGAEIGISTQKLHARGPFALDALTSYKYVCRGDGQIRD